MMSATVAGPSRLRPMRSYTTLGDVTDVRLLVATRSRWKRLVVSESGRSQRSSRMQQGKGAASMTTWLFFYNPRVFP